jgi:enamine deaminase RidA (YjgF/YER057c/UK114 family)
MNDTHPESAPCDRRLFLGASALGLAAGLRASEVQAAEGTTTGIKALAPPDAPAAANGYSPGILATGSRVIFVSGQGPADLKADMETQIRQTFDRIGLVLKEGGASFKHVTMLRAYFVNISRDLPIYRKVRLDYLADAFPASTAIGVPELAIPDLEIEIEAIAIL